MCNVNGATRCSSSLVFSFFLEIFLQIVGRITCPTLYHLLTGLWSYSSKRYYPIKLKCYTWVMLPFMWAIIPSNSCSLCVGENHMSAVADLIHWPHAVLYHCCESLSCFKVYGCPLCVVVAWQEFNLHSKYFSSYCSWQNQRTLHGPWLNQHRRMVALCTSTGLLVPFCPGRGELVT